MTTFVLYQIMKKIIYILPFILFSQLNAQTRDVEQGRIDFLRNKSTITQPVPANIQKHFDIALNEIEKMLNGEKPLSFKRAVFLVENAFYAGELCWEEYSNEIARIVPILNEMIDSRGFRRHRTAGNWAIFTFMSESIPENDFRPFQYDFENFMSDTDLESLMVSRLLQTRLGNCRALPYLYKILANELGVEAHIAIVPMHVYVMHRDEQGVWWNLEMTTGSFSRSSFIMETFNVSETAIRSGLFMNPMSHIQAVAHLINDLLFFYEHKTGRYSDEFVRRAYQIGLKHHPNSPLQIIKLNDLQFQIGKKSRELGVRSNQEFVQQPEIMELFNAFIATRNFIIEMGYSRMRNEDYERAINHIREQQMLLRLEK